MAVTALTSPVIAAPHQGALEVVQPSVLQTTKAPQASAVCSLRALANHVVRGAARGVVERVGDLLIGAPGREQLNGPGSADSGQAQVAVPAIDLGQFG